MWNIYLKMYFFKKKKKKDFILVRKIISLDVFAEENVYTSKVKNLLFKNCSSRDNFVLFK